MIGQLVNYGLQTGLLHSDDVIYTRNRLLDVMQLDEYLDSVTDEMPLHVILDTLTEREAYERVCDFNAVENCMTEKEARQEASRCLRCDHFGYGIFKGGRETLW